MTTTMNIGDRLAGTLIVRNKRFLAQGWVYTVECEVCGYGEEVTARAKRRKACTWCKTSSKEEKIKHTIMDDDGKTPIALLAYLEREGMTGDPRDRVARWNSANRDPKPYKTREWILYGKSSKSRKDSLLDHLFDRLIKQVVADTSIRHQIDRIYVNAIKTALGKEGRKELRKFLRMELMILQAQRKGSDEGITPSENLDSFLVPVDPDDLD